MAFGRKKRDDEDGEQAEQPVEESPAAGDVAVAGDEPTAPASPGDEPTAPASPDDADAREPAEESEQGSAAAPPDAGGDLSEAAAPAGDPAAAGVEAEGPGADRSGDTSTHAVPAATDASPEAAPTTRSADPEALGSAAASPDPATVPAAHGPDPSASSDGEATSGPDAGAGDKPSDAMAQAQTLVEERPEVLAAGAFAAGLIFARILGAFGGRR